MPLSSVSPRLRPLLLQLHSKQFRRSFAAGGGTRGSRGHGWLQKYRNNDGGRHLQGDHWDFPSLQEKMEWNNHVFDMMNKESVVSVYLDVQIIPTGNKQTSSSTASASATEQQPDINSSSINKVTDISVASITDNNIISSSNQSPTTRLTIELATFATPVTSQNFTLLCQDKLYVNTVVDRMEKNVGWVMGGSMTKHGGRSVGHCHSSLSTSSSNSSSLFQDDPLVLWHIPGIVSMLSPRVNEIDSRFILITNESCSQLDGRHVPFGRLTDESLQFLQSTSIFTKRGVPTSDVVVVDCGVLTTTTTDGEKSRDDEKKEQVAAAAV